MEFKVSQEFIGLYMVLQGLIDVHIVFVEGYGVKGCRV